MNNLENTLLKRRYAKLRKKMFIGRPDLTPLVDVFFILLLFFLLSSSFIQISGVQVELPRVEASYTGGSMERHIITVAWAPKGNQIYFNDMPLTLDALKQELANLGLTRPQSSIFLYCDYRVPSGQALEILTLARKANLPVVYATMPKNKTEQTVFQ